MRIITIRACGFAAAAVLESLEKSAVKQGDDLATWRWGRVHTLQTKFFGPVGSLFLPPDGDKSFPGGFPRHGGDGTVDVANHGADDDFYSFGNGAAIRFTCELDPVKGPVARNILPGGQIFMPGSPHYRDQMDLWRKNETRDLPFLAADVVKEATEEQATNKLGRRRFTPLSFPLVVLAGSTSGLLTARDSSRIARRSSSGRNASVALASCENSAEKRQVLAGEFCHSPRAHEA